MTRLFHPAVHCRMLFLSGLLLGLALLPGGVPALAQEQLEAQVSGMAQERLEVQVSGGYQQEYLHWSIAGNSAGRNPNVYSELKWQRVGGISAGAALSWQLWRRLVVFAEGSRVSTLSGTVSDRDYSGDNRTGPVYDGHFEAHKGYAYTIISGAGYRLWTKGRFRLEPGLGYGWSGQRLSIEGAGGLLNSWYRTWWKGILLRLPGEWQAGGRWGVLFEGRYHQVNYRADADWNLIRAFSHPVSFRQWADGYGLDGEVGLRYAAGRHVRVALVGTYFNWRTGTGVDELYLASGQTSQTQLNEVVLEGFGIRAGLRLGFD